MKAQIDPGTQNPSDAQQGFSFSRWLPVLLLVTLTFLVLSSTLNNRFVNYDDPVFVQHNTFIRNLGSHSLRWMFTTFHQGNWSPLTWLSFALDYRMGMLEPHIYHLSNLLLHLANTLIVFLLALKNFGRLLPHGSAGVDGDDAFARQASFLTAMLFGIHPLHVEPVAWITDRIDLLCAFFYLLSLLCYLNHVTRRQPGISRYLLSLGFFFGALMSKSMSLSLPFVLLLVDWLLLGRFRSDQRRAWLEKVPYLLAAFLLAVISVLARSKAGSIADFGTIPFDYRVMNAFHSIGFYLWKTLAPVKLNILYPMLVNNTYSPAYILSALFVVSTTIACFSFRKTRPFIAAAWFFYLVTLGPALGLLHVGSQSAADRYFYIPSLGPFLLISALVPQGLSGRKVLFVVSAGLIVAMLGFASRNQAGVWRDSITLWENVLKSQNRNSAVAYINLGDAYREAGRLKEALALLDHSIKLDPAFILPRNIKGKLFFDLGEWEEAEKHFTASVELEPKDAWARCHLAVIYAKADRNQMAAAEARQAVSLNPDEAWLHFEIGRIYHQHGMAPEALEETLRALAIDPNFAEAHHQLGLIYEEKKGGDPN